MKKILATLCLVSFMPIITGCSKTAKNISPTYVSPLQYQHYSCDQIRQELLRVNRRVLEVSGQQDNAAPICLGEKQDRAGRLERTHQTPVVLCHVRIKESDERVYLHPPCQYQDAGCELICVVDKRPLRVHLQL